MTSKTLSLDSRFKFIVGSKNDGKKVEIVNGVFKRKHWFSIFEMFFEYHNFDILNLVKPFWCWPCHHIRLEYMQKQMRKQKRTKLFGSLKKYSLMLVYTPFTCVYCLAFQRNYIVVCSSQIIYIENLRLCIKIICKKRSLTQLKVLSLKILCIFKIITLAWPNQLNNTYISKKCIAVQ